MWTKVLSARGQDVEAHAKYFAGALSAVFHPQNPYVPTFRCDVRYFEIEGGNGWFGGGADLTPCYLFEEDGHGFHSFYKHICSKYGSTLYAKSKAACDNYFFLPSRKEYRGIGGIFFDDLEKLEDDGRTFHHSKEGYMDESARIKTKRQSLEAVFCFVREVAEGFLLSYLPILEKRRGIKYGERERQWQLLRRGRYVEFNLLYDRGVKFGLDGGRIESIMVSAPPLVAWKYDIKPEPNSAESMLVDVLTNPRDWA
ncbi:hypothetical protein O6H91_02G036800 [Diphasiastrum complanatum]|uniref:Uncharacterized protein n=1 Tax=Diphasiastrum complanatum TaxID=34168 RepID=A0ACC2EET1_DIPCM|nr:hypothetical protein O6H91_02G036800 [Diphasiastrum complanatum]